MGFDAQPDWNDRAAISIRPRPTLPPAPGIGNKPPGSAPLPPSPPRPPAPAVLKPSMARGPRCAVPPVPPVPPLPPAPGIGNKPPGSAPLPPSPPRPPAPAVLKPSCRLFDGLRPARSYRLPSFPRGRRGSDIRPWPPSASGRRIRPAGIVDQGCPDPADVGFSTVFDQRGRIAFHRSREVAGGATSVRGRRRFGPCCYQRPGSFARGRSPAGISPRNCGPTQ